jgi:hypothetical protein
MLIISGLKISGVESNISLNWRTHSNRATRVPFTPPLDRGRVCHKLLGSLDRSSA